MGAPSQKNESRRPMEPPRQPLTQPWVTLARRTALLFQLNAIYCYRCELSSPLHLSPFTLPVELNSAFLQYIQILFLYCRETHLKDLQTFSRIRLIALLCIFLKDQEVTYTVIAFSFFPW